MFETQDLPATSAPQMDASALATPGSSPPVHLLDRLAAVFKHRRLAGAAFIIVVGLMMMQTYSQVPMYRTSSRVMIQHARSPAAAHPNPNPPPLPHPTPPPST